MIKNCYQPVIKVLRSIIPWPRISHTKLQAAGSLSAPRATAHQYRHVFCHAIASLHKEEEEDFQNTRSPFKKFA